MEAVPKRIEFYVTAKERVPVAEWLDSLKDEKGRAQIKKRLRRAELGNLGEYSFVGRGVYEMKIHIGPGYRIYFGMEGTSLILLLCGGDKSSPSQDIKLAQKFWVEWKSS